MTTDDSRPIKPVVLDVHCEPNDSFLTDGKAHPWGGFEKGAQLMSELRDLIHQRSGAPAHFCWQFRADSQIERAYGTPGWALENYRQVVERMQRNGDDIGLHQHAYRWNENSQSWTEDYGDSSWMAEVVHLGFDTYREHFGTHPLSFAGGVTWTSQEVLQLVESLGARYDLSLAPGRNKPFPTKLGAFTGNLPDTSDMPPYPYQPSTEDFRRPAGERDDGLWIIPLSTGLQTSGGLIRRTLRRVAGQTQKHRFISKMYAQLPIEYLSPVFGVRHTNREPTHFSLDIRSDAFRTRKNRAAIRRNMIYLTSSERPYRYVFMTPAELVAHYRQHRGAVPATE